MYFKKRNLILFFLILLSSFYWINLQTLKAQTLTYLYFPLEKQESENRLLGIQNRWFQVKGDLKVAFTAAQEDTTLSFNNGLEGILHQNQAPPRFFLQELLLKSQFSLSNQIKGDFQIRILPDAISIKKGYGIIDLPLNSFIQFGLDRRFFSRPIYYEAIIPPLITTAFGGEPDLSIIIGGKVKIFGEKNNIFWKSSVSNGQRFSEAANTAHVGKQRTYPVFQDTTQMNSFDTHKEVGFGLGFDRHISKNEGIEFLAFSFFSRLNEKDLDQDRETIFLQNVISNYHSDDRRRQRIGADTKIQWSPYELWAHYIHAIDGAVRRHAFAVEPSFSFTFPFSKSLLFDKSELIYRWNHLNIRVRGLADNIPASPFTWDRTTHTVAMKMYSKYFFTWQNEFHLNLEKTGSTQKKVKNNEFLSQIIFYF